MMPRRASKTTGLLVWLVGECMSRPDISASFSIVTTGKATRSKFLKELAPRLERIWPDEDYRPFRILRGSGQEQIRFDNGSVLSFLAPLPHSWRGDAFDIVVLDEAQEAEPELADDLLSAILPTLDTRPDSMVVITGTAGEYREGNLLYEELEAGRAGDPRHAIIDYHVPDMTAEAFEGLDDWADVEPLVRSSHPGVGGLTPVDAVLDNWRKLDRVRFAREYLGIFGEVRSSSILPLPVWVEGSNAGKLPKPPRHFRLGLAVHPDHSSAAIVAAWRDADRRAHIVVLDHRPGIGWVYEECRRLVRKYDVPVAYDSGQSSTTLVSDRFARARPKVKSEPLSWPQVSTAAALVVSEVHGRNVEHYAQPMLDAAVRDVVKRGTNGSKRWGFGRAYDDADITPLEAAALALKAFDDAPAARPTLELVVG